MCSLLLLSGCEEDTEPLAYPPTLVTGSVTEMTRFEASLTGTAIKNPKSIINCEIGFMVSTSQSMADAQLFAAQADGSSNNLYTGQAKGLTPGKEYYFCLYALSGTTLVKGSVQPFTTTVSIPPVLKEPTVSDGNESSATFQSEIIDNGGYEPTTKGFVYKVFVEGGSEPTIEDIIVPVPLLSEAFNATALELTPNTTYVIRAYATTTTGTGYSESITLTTDRLKIPVLSISAASKLTAYTATISGTISDHQGYPATQRGFCWSAENRLPTKDGKHVVATGTDDTFTEVVGKEDALLPNTKYYMRAYADNEKGTGYSAVTEFTTQELQMASLTQLVISNVTIASVTITAHLEYSKGAEITESGICWSATVQSPTTADTNVPAAAENNRLSATINGLEEGKTYYATAYATTRDGNFYSQPIAFSTEKTTTPAISTPTVKDIEETTTTGTAAITNIGGTPITAKGLCWSATNKEPAISDEANCKFQTATDTGNGITVKMTGLTKGTKYFVRAYATNKNGISYSATAEFTTANTTEPVVGNPLISEVSETGGKVTATVTSDGGSTLTEKGVCYSKTKPEPDITDSKTPSTAAGNSISATLTGLLKGEIYYVRAYATNKNGTAYSVVAQLRTTSSVEPTLSSITVTDINDDNAKGKAFIANDGGAAITAKGFVWSAGQNTNPTLESHTGKVVSTSAGSNFEALLTDPKLSYNTDYTVRAYATNTEGTGYSEPISFVTGSSTAPVMNINTEHTTVTSRTASGAVISAMIDNDGGAPVTEVGVYWWKSSDSSVNGTVKATLKDNSFTATLTGLTHQTAYHVQPYATNKNGKSTNSPTLSFETEKLPPLPGDNDLPGAVTGKKPTMNSIYSSGTFPTRLELRSSISDAGGLAITAKGFVWSLTESRPEVGKAGCTHIPITTEGNEMKTVLYNLTPGTRYYVSVYATNEKGTGFSYNSFQTEAAKPEPGEDDNPTPGVPQSKTTKK